VTAREKTFGCGKKTFGSRDEKSRDTRKSNIYGEFDRRSVAVRSGRRSTTRVPLSRRGLAVSTRRKKSLPRPDRALANQNAAQPETPPAVEGKTHARGLGRSYPHPSRRQVRARKREVSAARSPRAAAAAAAARPRAALRVWRDARDRQMNATGDDPPPLGSIVAVGSRARPRRLRAPSRPRASEPDRQKRDRAPPPPLSDSARVPRTDRPRLRPSNAPVQNNENLQTRTQKPLEQEDVRPHAVRRRRARARRRQGPGPRPQGSLRGRREG